MRIRPVKIFRFKKTLFTLLLVAVVIGATLLITKSLQAPAVGSVAQTPASKAEVVDPLAKPSKYDGKYVSFPYPPHYRTTPASLTGNYLEVADFHFVEAVSRQINVGIYISSLDNDGSVNFRKKHPELYRENTSSLGLEFVKIDGSEDTFFLTHNDMIASISVLGPTAVTDNDALFVASGLHWH